MNHDFPGNVRELENIIEHAFVLCRGKMILPEHLPQHLRPEESKVLSSAAPTNMQELEASFISNALRKNNWNRAATARELGMHKTTLRRKIKRLGIEAPGKLASRRSDKKP